MYNDKITDLEYDVHNNSDNDEEEVKVFIKEIERIPKLSFEEETQLIHRYMNGDETAKQRLIEGNIYRVVKIARNYIGNGIPLSELISEGNIVLINSIDGYDPTKGMTFKTYTGGRIHSYYMYITDKYKKRINKNRYILQSSYTIDDIIDTDFDISDEDIFENVSNMFLKEDLLSLMKTITSREEDILLRYYGLIDSEETFKEIAKSYNLHMNRISQIHNKAIRKMQHHSRSRKIRDYYYY